jgi:chromate reductase, NAD(P)H dehydrogenase (quinone)
MRIMLVSGSARSGSTNTAALRTAADVAPDGVAMVLGHAEPPLFNPDDDPEGGSVAAPVGTYGKPVAWINVSGAAAPTGGETIALAVRRLVAHAGAGPDGVRS